MSGFRSTHPTSTMMMQSSRLLFFCLCSQVASYVPMIKFPTGYPLGRTQINRRARSSRPLPLRQGDRDLAAFFDPNNNAVAVAFDSSFSLASVQKSMINSNEPWNVNTCHFLIPWSENTTTPRLTNKRSKIGLATARLLLYKHGSNR
jgi:hypothetical protein